MNEQQIIELVKNLSLPGAFTVVCYLFFKSPLASAVADWIRSKVVAVAIGPEKRLKDLEAFQFSAETNHFHDLENVMQGQVDLRKDFDNFRVMVERRFTVLETKSGINRERQ